MESTLGWIELSADALRKMRAELDEEGQGVVDELGVLALHTGYADRFFPGTSVLHTRPRYLFFVCWNYLTLAAQGVSRAEIAGAKKDAEIWITRELRKLDPMPNGIIGKLVYPKPPSQPLDFIYWTALKQFGFYVGSDRGRLARDWDPSRIVHIPPDAAERSEDDTVQQVSLARIHCPPTPHFWLQARPRHQLSFDLEPEEALFLKRRLVQLENPCLLSEAARLLPAGKPGARSVLWDEPIIHEAAARLDEEPVLMRARQASSLALVLRGMYAALVEKVALETVPTHTGASESGYRERLSMIWSEHPDAVDDIRRLDRDALQKDIPDLPFSFRSLLEHVQERVGRARGRNQLADLLLDEQTEQLAARVERSRKGDRRARLPRTAAGLERRRDFQAGTINVQPLDYRWAQVRTLLADLAAGLRS